MRKINQYIRQLSLTQQLFALIFFFVSFFAVFFFVYIYGNVDKVVTDQIYESLNLTQRSILASQDEDIQDYEGLPNTTTKTPSPSNIVSYVVKVDGKNASLIKISYGENVDVNSEEWQQIRGDIFALSDGNTGTNTIKGIKKDALNSQDSYYMLTKIGEKQLLLTKTYSENMDSFRDALVKSVIYLTVLVVGFFFIIMILWVTTLIHPLNQIRNYIERVKNGKSAELKVSRRDEIGELADAIVSMREELLRQEKTKEEMIHNISHDLKTPIATIKSYSESIKDGIYPYDTLEKSVDVIIENADRLEKKVHSLLYMNRVEYLISQDSEGALTNMQDVIEKVLKQLMIQRSDIEYITDLHEVYFEGLEEPWRVCVENIVENALRYAKSNITIKLNEEDGLQISNDGDCMDEERIRCLFKPFEKGREGKFGLGLSIVFKVVNANHYEVSGENMSDGVIFRIYKTKEQK